MNIINSNAPVIGFTSKANERPLHAKIVTNIVRSLVLQLTYFTWQ